MPPPATPSSSSDDPSSQSSDSEPDPNIKPLASKPMDEDDDDDVVDNDPPRKPRSKIPTLRYSPSPIKSKRPAPAPASVPETKRVKNGGEKKQLFQRLWSEDDEIELIKGMISYFEKKGKDPVGDFNDFHGFVKKSLNVNVSFRQISAKVRRLKKKFMNNVGRIEKSGKVRAFSNPHEKKMYELSKKLWGNCASVNKDSNYVSFSPKKVNLTPKSNQSQTKSKSLVEGSKIEVPIRITDEEIMKRGLELVSGAKKVELEEKWKDLKVLEVEHFLKKLELMKEQTEIVLNAMKKSRAK